MLSRTPQNVKVLIEETKQSSQGVKAEEKEEEDDKSEKEGQKAKKVKKEKKAKKEKESRSESEQDQKHASFAVVDDDHLYVTKYSSSKVNDIMDSAKLKHRTSLKLHDWQRYGYYSTFREWRDKDTREMEKLDRRHQRGDTSYAQHIGVEKQAKLVIGCDRVHCDDLSIEQFVEKYEKPYLPVMISGLADKWPAIKNWTLTQLSQGPYRDLPMKCGEDDEGYSIKTKLKYFVQYLHSNRDDSPLYVFDSGFGEREEGKDMLTDYEKPKYFTDDLFSLVGEKRRPPYRWMLVGPERSGTNVHRDPLGTSAWNTLLRGKKRWVMFKPGCPADLVEGDLHRQKGEDNEAATYFTKVLPRIRADEEKKATPDLGMIECIQYPGETIFVPGGWWHAVLNLEDTVAVTQNFASRTNFPVVWKKTRKGRKHMAKRWLDKLEEEWPDLAATAHRLNKEDSFEFIFSDKSKKKKKDKDAKKKKKKKESMMSMK